MVDNELITKVRTRNVKSILSNVFTSSGGGGGTWGSITGTLSSQTDLQSALDDKFSLTNGGTLLGASVLLDGDGNTFTINNADVFTLGATTSLDFDAPAFTFSNGAVSFEAGTTGYSSLKIPHGVAPTSPVDGDFWSTTAGFFGRVNGATVGPFGTGGGGLTVGTTTITSGTNTRVLYNNSGVLGEYTVSGSGNVAMTTSPVFTTPNIGTATGTASGNWSLSSGGTLTGANTITGTTTNILKGVFNSLGTTQTNGAGLWLANTTAAAAGAQQISPSLVLEGQGWKTNATAESQSVIFKQYVTPVQGTSNPSGTLNTYSSINGGADTQVGWSYSSDGSVRDNGTISLGVAGSRNALVNLHSTGYSTGDGIIGTITTSGDEIRYSRLGTNILRFTSNGLVIAGTRIGISNTAYLATSNGRVGLYQTEDSGNLQAVISLFNNSVGGNSSANRYVGWYNGTAQPTSANADYALTYAKDANGAGTASLAIMSEDDYETIIGSLNKFPQPVIIGGTSLTTSALLDLQSTTRAFIPPRMTTAQKTAITSPSAGMIVYDSDLSSIQVYTSSWSAISAQTTVSNNDNLGSGNVQWISGSDTGKKYETYFSSNVSSSWDGASTSTNILNTVPDNSVIVVTINFTGVQTSGTAGSSGFHYKVTRAFRRTTTTTTAIGAAEVISSSNDTGDTFGTVPTISTSGSNINFDRALTTTKTFNVSLRVEVEVTD